MRVAAAAAVIGRAGVTRVAGVVTTSTPSPPTPAPTSSGGHARATGRAA